MLVAYGFARSFEEGTSLGNCICITCAHLRMHFKKSYPCSRIGEVENKMWNPHAELPKASHKETHLFKT